MKISEIAAPGYERVTHFEDEQTGLNAIISVHNTALGPAIGGCRMFPYANFDAGLDDVLRLSRGMTYKNALAHIPFGGGKSVIFGDPKTEKTPDLMRAFGEAVTNFGGIYNTAEDSGIGEQDLKYVRERTKWVGGIHDENHPGGNPSPYTARGVWRGIQATARHKLGADTLSGVSVFVLGLGAVGMELSQLLHEEGARLIVADIDEAKVAQAVEKFDAERAKIADADSQSADVFAPCALGGAVNPENIDRLCVKMVAGAANNQLRTPEMGQKLFEKGILYAPDYVINAAGVISVGLDFMGEWTEAALLSRIDGIAATLREIYQRSDREATPTHIIADKMAEEIIAAPKS